MTDDELLQVQDREYVQLVLLEAMQIISNWKIIQGFVYPLLASIKFYRGFTKDVCIEFLFKKRERAALLSILLLSF